jgi:hypothetical protein
MDNLGFKLWQRHRFFTSAKSAEWRWGPPNLLSKGHQWVLSPSIKSPEHEADHSPPLRLYNFIACIWIASHFKSFHFSKFFFFSQFNWKTSYAGHPVPVYGFFNNDITSQSVKCQMTDLIVMNEKNVKEDSHGLTWCIPAGAWWEKMRKTKKNVRIANVPANSKQGTSLTQIIISTTGCKNPLSYNNINFLNFQMITQLRYDRQSVVKEYSHDDQLHTHPISSPFKLQVSRTWHCVCNLYTGTKILQTDEECTDRGSSNILSLPALTLTTIVQNIQTTQTEIPLTIFHQTTI